MSNFFFFRKNVIGSTVSKHQIDVFNLMFALQDDLSKLKTFVRGMLGIVKRL